MAKTFRCTGSSPIVQTKQGLLRGFQSDRVYSFFGIQYAQAKRFHAPQPVSSWEGVKDALNYGYVCPLLEQPLADKELLVPHRYWLTDENCLNLNIWTTSIDPAAKKPVMVWIHGGAFSSGSALEHVAYEGDHLCEYGDVVVVSVNHRLHLLGYLDLSAYGEEYANSGNNGQADLVQALRWVQENISAFGGDPDNVTLFGQSCGGTKITCLMNTPAADGLYHKVIVQSGAIDLGDVDGTGEAVAEEMLRDLGFPKGDIKPLETIDMHTLGEAYKRAALKISKEHGYFGSWPQQNDWYKGEPRKVGFTEYAHSVPMLAGSVMGEFCFETGVQDKYALSKEESMKLLTEKYGEHAAAVAQAFEQAYPDKHLTDALYIDQSFRELIKDLIDLRTREGGSAPTYSYLLTYDFPMDGGKVAWHCSDVPFVFHNTDRAPQYNVPGETDRLEARMCSAWANFARFGTPQIDDLPEWPACEPEQEHTMLLDNTCRVTTNHDDALFDALHKTNTATILPLITSVVTDPDGPVIVH